MTAHDQQEQSLDGNPPAAITKRDRARFLTHEVKASVRDLLHHDDGQQPPARNEIFEDAAFDPQKVLQPGEAPPKASFGDRFSLGAKSVKNALKNPKAASRNNYTRHAATKIANHPHDQSTAFDDELLDAHDALERLVDAQEKAVRQPRQDVSGAKVSANDVGDARTRLQHIDQQRKDLKSGWILGRHVMRAKVIKPVVSKPERSQFLVASAQTGKRPHLQWKRYLGHLALWYTDSFTAHRIDDFDEPPFDLHELALGLERLIAVSTPWQSYWTKFHDIYCWDDPNRTVQIMVAYWVLWYFQQIATFAFAFVIYITVRNKFYPSNVEAIRERAQRSQDRSAKVRAWGELIQKHGDTDWIEPLLDAIGPHIQMQMSDLTMFLDRLQNFYRWERPQQTWLSLSVFLFCFLFSLLTSIELCVRIVWFGAGCIFFYSFPIASNYPKYRHVVSPLCWIFWGIPDSAELAISQLQQKAILRDENGAAALEREEGPSHPGPETKSDFSSSYDTISDIETAMPKAMPSYVSDPLRRFRAKDHLTFKTILLPKHTPCHVTLTRSHIILEPDKQPSMTHPYTSLLEMRKLQLSQDANQTSSSADTNSISRSTHIATWLEQAANVQLLPDGLGFIFLQEDSEGTSHLSDLQGRNLTSSTRLHAEDPGRNTKSSPEHDSSTTPLHSSHVDRQPQEFSTDKHQAHKTEFTLILNKSDRDKIFTVVLAWSGLTWQPLYSMDRQNKLGNRRNKGEGNRNLDDAIKKALS